MALSDEQWWVAQCGEYVLGTLRDQDRDVFEKILQVDTDAQARVHYWSNTLSALDIHTPAINPPHRVLQQVLERVQTGEPLQGRYRTTATTPDIKAQTNIANEQGADDTFDVTSDLDDTLNSSADQVAEFDKSPFHLGARLEERQHSDPTTGGSALWKRLAMISTAAAIALGVLLFNTTSHINSTLTLPDVGSFSILQDAQQQVLWLVTMESNSDRINIKALKPPPTEPTRSHQLWMVKTNGEDVRSVGLLPRYAGENRTIKLPYPVKQAKSFAVSLEPSTGSPKATPSGHILFNAALHQVERKQ